MYKSRCWEHRIIPAMRQPQPELVRENRHPVLLGVAGGKADSILLMQDVAAETSTLPARGASRSFA